MAGSDVQRVAAWLSARLAADATLSSLGNTGVYDGDAPPEAAYPFCLVYETGNSVTRGTGGLHVLTTVLYGVKFMAQGRSYEALRPLAERAIALLDGVTDHTADLEVLDVARSAEHKAAYLEDGVSYRELGMIWRVIARAT